MPTKYSITEHLSVVRLNWGNGAFKLILISHGRAIIPVFCPFYGYAQTFTEPALINKGE